MCMRWCARLGGAGVRAGASAASQAGGPATAVMFGVGRAGTLGGVWRQPPLALSEFSTHPAEMMQVRCSLL